tara:strand:+ start:582 stop:833 length:252 start_codon:yes stop_codon:yes gene_type:complete
MNNMDKIIDSLWENKEKDMKIMQTYKSEKEQLRKDIAKFKQEQNEALDQMDEFGGSADYISYLETQQSKLIYIIRKYLDKSFY